MSLQEAAKIVWRWHSLLPQIATDYRYHRQFKDLRTPLARRLFEQLILLWHNRINAADYYNMGLFDPDMPMRIKRSYIGRYEIWRLFLAFNPMEHQHLTNKKLEFNAYASAAGLPTAEVIGLVSRHHSDYGVPSFENKEDLGAWMIKSAIGDVVLKPVDGTKGWGVLSIGKQIDKGRWKKLPRGDTINMSDIWSHCARYLYRGGVIVQRRLIPHPTLARLMPDVLHTVRVITYMDTEPMVIDAILRVGIGNVAVDNMAQGGIVVPLDMRDGRCGQGTRLINGLPQRLDDHPVTGNRITDAVVPDWERVRELAKAAARRFSMLKSIGWDVGVTRDGPVLLEGNACYDLTVNQLARGKGILATCWIDAFNKEGAYKRLGLGFCNNTRTD